jgi:hypothetical protein
LTAAALAAGVLLSGCGGAAEEKHEFKQTDTTQFKGMQDMMINQMKTKSYRKGATGAPEAGKAEEGKAEEKK